MINLIHHIYEGLSYYAAQHPGVLFLLASAAIFAMPPKDSQFSLRMIYGFFYDWFHAIIGMRFPQNSSSVTITPSKTEATTTTSETLPKQI